MDTTMLVITALGLLASVVDFIPVVNVVTAIVGATGAAGEAPTWWSFALMAGESVMVLQWLMPWFEKITKRTANTWDDGLYARAKMILAFAVEILAAVGAADPQLGRRIKAITGPRRTRA